MKRFGLDEKVIERVNSVFNQSAKIQRVIIYGSRATGQQRQGSDIDLTLVGPSLISDDLARIENQIDDLMLPYKFDLSLFHHIDNAGLLSHIEQYGRPFWP